MKETYKRILTALIIGIVFLSVITLEYFFNIKILNIFITALSILIVSELFIVFYKNNFLKIKNYLILLISFIWGMLFIYSSYQISKRVWILLLIAFIVITTDVSAWFFGKKIKSDKLWSSISPNKTWAGQIMGIVCGTFASVLYGLLGEDVFMPQLFWIGISVSLLSQYGDLTASYIKRKLNIKDFGKILPGHGGLLDRFDGYIYIIPIIYLIII